MTSYCLEYLSDSSKATLDPFINKDYRLNRKLSFTAYPNALLLPGRTINGTLYGCVVTENGDVVPQSKFNEAYIGYYDHPEPKRSDDRVILVVFTYCVWGHILTDALKRLWFMYTDECSKLTREGYKLVAMFDHDFRQRKNLRRVFELLDIDPDKFVTVTEPTVFREVIVPDVSISFRDNMYYYTEEYSDTIDRIKSNIKPRVANADFPEKVYLTRCNLASAVNARDYGERRIERLFSKAGYKIISPEILDIDSQIALMMGACTVATTEGSIAHSILFARPHTRLVILRKADYVNDFQIMANNVADADVTYIDASHSSLAPSSTPWTGPFYLYPTRYLYRYLGVKGCVRPPLLDPTYLRYNIDHRPSLAIVKNAIAICRMPFRDKVDFLRKKLKI